MSKTDLSGVSREQCSECGEVHSHCPLCEDRVEAATHLKNGAWSIEYIPDSDFEHFCAEWNKNHLNIFWHGGSDE